MFQNRYKSILCQEDPYLLEPVRYIHLNPLRAKLVADMDVLGKYPFCGHGVIMGKCVQPWQDIETIYQKLPSYQLLLTIPGYGPYIAPLVLSALANPMRFKSRK